MDTPSLRDVYINHQFHYLYVKYSGCNSNCCTWFRELQRIISSLWRMQPVGALSQVLLGNREKSYQIWCQHELPIKTNSETIQGPKRPSSTRRSAVCSCTQVLGWTQASSIVKSFNPSQIDWGNTCAPSFPKRFVLPLAQCEQQVNIGFSPKATMKQHGHPPSNQRWNVQATERNGWSQSELTAPMFESLPYPKHQWKLQLSRFPKWKLRKVLPNKFWILHIKSK